MPRVKADMRVMDETWNSRKAMLDKLAGSGLTADDATALSLEPLPTAPEGLPLSLGGFRIPYHDPDGQASGFFRFRYTEPEPKRKGFAGQTKTKPIRYAQPAGSLPRVYFPRLADHVDWLAWLADPGRTLAITEGELKAACATRLGIPTIGIGGVWSWCCRGKALDMLPDLAAIPWKGRPTYIIFDSDAVRNDKVIQAENALARALANLGAVVHIVRLPELTGDDAKTGLDDYLVHTEGGPAMLHALLADAQPWVQVEMLHRLNAEVVLLRDQSRVYRLADRQILSPQDFIGVAYAPWVYWDRSGEKPKKVSAPAEWLKWPGRAEASGLVFEPGKDLRVGQAVNTWTGWGCEPAPGDISPWSTLLSHLFADEPEACHWFEQWCAYPLQHPGVKLFSACLLWGRYKGTGKTALAYALGKIHGTGFREIKAKDLHGNFNGWLVNRTLIYGDEITASDARVDSEYMKGLVTQQEALVNEKYEKPYVVRDCANHLYTANGPDALFIEDDDRRYFIHEVRVPPLPPAFYHDVFDPWLHGDGPSHLFHHLLHDVNMSGFHPYARAMETQAKDDMLELGRSDVGRWLASVRRNPKLLAVNGTPVFQVYTTQELLNIYDPLGKTRVTANGLGRELVRQGIRRAAKGYTCKLPCGCVRLWIMDESLGKLESASVKDIEMLWQRERKGVRHDKLTRG